MFLYHAATAIFAFAFATDKVSASARVSSTALVTSNELKDALKSVGYDAQASAIEKLSKPTGASCSSSCNLLSALLDDIVSLQGSTSYNQQEASYWSNQQAETKPTCRVQPTLLIHISVTLLVSQFFNCPFAVKSGGHAAFAGASNIEGGVTIDLARLKQIQVSSDRTLTRVGAGNRWVDVYSHLDPMQLSVVGGRVADIGVGGLTLGGGISFFSGRYGWALDSVINYEVVLANGQVIEVNQQSYPDLYFALRGGGNNFGVVTRFDLETFPQGDMWGGMQVLPASTNQSLFEAYNNFANNAPSDPDAALILSFAYAEGMYIADIDCEYAKPVPDPPIFQEITAIQPTLLSTLRVTTLKNLTLELNAANPSGLRETYITATFRNSPVLQSKILDIWYRHVETIKDAEGILPAITMQPITKSMVRNFSKRGGNALGISVEDAPLLLISPNIMWSAPTDDARILAAANAIIDESIATAQTMQLDYRYIYQNYASLGQDVFAGYGPANRQRLIEISKKYDPDQVFQKLQPGYFKLGAVSG